MNSRNKFFSSALFLENLRRFWLIDLAAFAFYFLSGPIEFIADNGDIGTSIANTFISSSNPGFLMIGAGLSVIAAVTVFSYLNKTGSTCVMHSMPFSRRKLFITNYVSGLLIASIPLILTCLLLLCLVQPVVTVTYDINGLSHITYDETIFSVAAVMKTLGVHLVNTLFTYNLSVLACTLSGNGVIATLTACAFNCLAPALYLCTLRYADAFIWGAYVSTAAEEVVKLHPIIMSAVNNYMNNEMMYTSKYVVLYMLIAVAASIAAYYVYKLRPLETAGDSYSFVFMEKFVVICITFLVSSVFGLIALEGFENQALAYLTFLLTAVAAFVIGQMIAKKTFHVFNLESLKLMAVSLLIVMAILLSFVFDLFGFEKKMPERSEIHSVTVESWGLFVTRDYSVELKDPDNIDAMLQLHKDIVNGKEEISRHLEESQLNDEIPDYGHDISIKYLLNDGRTMCRSYTVSNAFLNGNESLDSVIQSDEVLKGLYDLRNINFKGAKVNYTFYGNEDYTYYGDGKYQDVAYDEDAYPKNIELPESIIPGLIEAIIADEFNIITKDADVDYCYLANIEVELPVTVIGQPDRDATENYLRNEYDYLFGYEWIEERVNGEYRIYFCFDVTSQMDETLKIVPKY